MTVRKWAVVSSLIVGLVGLPVPGMGPAFALSSAPDRLIITFPDGVPSTRALNRGTDVANLGLLNPIGDDMAVYTVDATLNGLGLAVLENDLHAVAPGARVSRDTWVTPTVIDDPLYNGVTIGEAVYEQTNLKDAYGVRASTAWATTTGTGVTVAVLDTGVRPNHEDLAGRTLPGYDFMPASLSNDGDGRDADPSDPGDYNTNPDTCDVGDSSWHGSHVSGIIAATQNNGLGISGLAPGAKILPVRVLGRCGGYTSDIITGLKWAAGIDVQISGVPVNTNPAKVANLSLGASNSPCGDAWIAALDDVAAEGMLVVSAAGNENVNTSTVSPAGCETDNMITVANILDHQIGTSVGTLYAGHRFAYTRSGVEYGSNFGSEVDIAAPGVFVWSAVDTGITVPAGDGYEMLTGTSMASPHVAAAAALVWAVNPVLTVAEVRNALLSTSRAFPTTMPGGGAIPATLDCLVKLCGSGALDAGAAVTWAAANIKPGAPTDVAAVKDGANVVVSWKAPSVTGSTAITTYTVYKGATAACTSSTTSCSISGLAPGSYSFTVTATNSVGTGPASATSNAVSFTTLPGAPTSVTAERSETSITVKWSAPSNIGGTTITAYTVSDALGGTHVVSGGSRQHVIDGLSPGATYSFSVFATNAVGDGAATSANSVTIPSKVSAPANVQVTVDGLTKLDVSWTAGTGGLAANWYKVTALPSGSECETSGTSCSIYALSAGTTYSVVVTASGIAGSPQSAARVLAATAAAVTTTTTTVAPTTTTPVVTSTVPALVRTVKRSSRTTLTRILTVPAGAKARWSAVGQCVVSGTKLVATTKKGTCRVTLKATKGGKTTTKSAVVKVV